MNTTDMNRPARSAEPFLVSSMHRHPSGQVRHVPGNNDTWGMSGTTTRGFLVELEEYVQARIQLALAERSAR